MLRSYRLPRTIPGWLLFVVLALLLALTAYALGSYAISREAGSDVAAYWGAAERIRAGEPLYLNVAGTANASDIYRYAPWFAYAWVPLTFLPREAVTAAWVALMFTVAIASTVPLLRQGFAGVAAVAFFAPLQIESAVYGNVQPLLILMLMWGVERRSGPLLIAIGASLKAVPLLLAIVYAGRGEWRRAGVAVLLTCLLVAPMLLVDLSGYSTQAGGGQLSLISVNSVLFIAVALGMCVAAYVAARSRYRWVAGALAMLAALPRFLPYEVGFLLIGAAKAPKATKPS